jgi:uncharacterized membrane protein
MQRAKVPISRVLGGPYGHPYHPALVTVPIGAWVSSLVFDVASHFTARPAFLAAGSEWLIAVGIAGAIVASLAGFVDLLSLAEGTPAYRTAAAHMVLNLLVTVLYAGDFLWRHRTYGANAPVGTGMLMLSAACVVLLTVSGFLGGRLAFRYGVRVAAEAAQEGGYLARDQRTARRRGEANELPGSEASRRAR